MVELLSPVQDNVSLRAAIESGADAVYFGVKSFNMRAKAKNFTASDLKRIVKSCHSENVKAYLTANTIIYDNELKKLEVLLNKAKEAGIDAIICWDFSVISLCKRLKIPFHISTQASVSNFEAVKYFAKLGAESVNLARELNLEQIKKIIKKIKKEKLKIKIETFVHGAMCVSVSGRCFISQFLFRKSANRGECLQPCRRQYEVRDIEENKKLKVGNNFVLSPKDLCTLPFIDKLVRAGIDTFKIEGRNRSPEYVKEVTESYREAIDNGFRKELMEKVKCVYNRKFSSGFYLGLPTNDDWTDIYGSAAKKKKIYAGIVKHFYGRLNVGEVKVEAYPLSVGDKIMIQGNKTGVFEQEIISMESDHKKIKKIDKGSAAIKFNRTVRSNDKIFVIRKVC